MVRVISVALFALSLAGFSGAALAAGGCGGQSQTTTANTSTPIVISDAGGGSQQSQPASDLPGPVDVASTGAAVNANARSTAKVVVDSGADTVVRFASRFTRASRNPGAVTVAPEPSLPMLAALGDWIATLFESFMRYVALIFLWLGGAGASR